MNPIYSTESTVQKIDKGGVVNIQPADVVILRGSSPLDDSFEVSEDGGATWREVDVRQSEVIVSKKEIKVRTNTSRLVLQVERKTLQYVAGENGETLPLLQYTSTPGWGVRLQAEAGGYLPIVIASADPGGVYSGIGERVLFDFSAAASTSGTAALINDGSVACPDPAYPTNIMQIGPSGVIDQALGAAIQSTGIETIGFWARAFRSSDAESFCSCKILLSDLVGGFTNFGVLPFAVRADGKWRYHTVKLDGVPIGGGTWTASSNIARIRFREADGVASDGRPLMSGADRVQFGPVRANPRGKTSMFIRFDDGLENLISKKKAVLGTAYVGSSGVNIPAGAYSFADLVDKFGFVANCYVLTDLIGNPGFETWSGLRELQSKGWSICVQAGANPVSNLSDGARLLGPIGYSLAPTPGGIASVAASVFTLSASRPDVIGGTAGSVAAGGLQSFPVVVGGTPPAPLVSGQTYYALRRGVRQFSLHTIPVANFPGDNDKGLVGITGSDVSQMTLRYAGSANDESAIYADYVKAQNSLKANGLTGFEHLALNQGGLDVYCEKAILAAGFKSVQTISNRVEFVPTFAGFVSLAASNVGLTPSTNGRNGTTLSGAFSVKTVIQTDGAISELNVRKFVADCVKYGSVGANYHHNETNLPVFLAYLDQLKIFADAGLLEVLSVEEQQSRIEKFTRASSL